MLCKAFSLNPVKQIVLAVADQIAISAFRIEIEQRISRTLEDNVARLGIYLEQLMAEAYRKAFTVNDAGGAADAILSEIEKTQDSLTLIFGTSKANSYLANLEYGERGTEGGSGPYSRTKAPPIRNIYQWIRRASLAIPKYFVERAERFEARKKKGSKVDTSKPWYSIDPITQYAFAIAMNIKRMGRPALRIIERTLTAQMAKIESYLSLT